MIDLQLLRGLDAEDLQKVATHLNLEFAPPKPAEVEEGRSSKWPAVRWAWLKKHPQCVICGGTEYLQVHHARPYHLFPELELVETNFRTLCEKPSRNCHLVFGHCYSWKWWNPLIDECILYWRDVLKHSLDKRDDQKSEQAGALELL